jgi:hypothetical protein
MAQATQAPYGRKTQREPAVKEVHVLWITAGLSCDGDSVSVTAATQPSIEDIVMGAIPGLPKVHLHNPVLAYEVGDEFMQYWHLADEGRLDAPFVLVIEGSIPNEQIKSEGYWAALGTDKKTGQPITTCEWIDRLAAKAWAVVAAGTCATYGGIHAMAGNPTGAMGLADYLGWGWRALQLPIDLAFFLDSTPAGCLIVLYPSPAGATESVVAAEAWRTLAEENPVLREFEPDVEGLLVNRVGASREYFRVGTDECYRLAGLIRTHWRGLSGGAKVWGEIARFFEGLHERSS